ncbi:hypothetical protein [Flexibacterium corallicola]|uniref:hypothetical protein n=1 Tax=Flexibacterium corallicola TaxID=3037259 RepID=UPI00286F9267|nr:hypothetical protein [Pseudovibrio sp. M1P-2-3]
MLKMKLVNSAGFMSYFRWKIQVSPVANLIVQGGADMIALEHPYISDGAVHHTRRL